MWPSVTYVVSATRLGTAYALMTLVQQVGVLAMNWALGWLNDTSARHGDQPRGLRAGTVAAGVARPRRHRVRVPAVQHERGPKAHGLETIRAGR
jgi:hypothetical protein